MENSGLKFICAPVQKLFIYSTVSPATKVKVKMKTVLKVVFRSLQMMSTNDTRPAKGWLISRIIWSNTF